MGPATDTGRDDQIGLTACQRVELALA